MGEKGTIFLGLEFLLTGFTHQKEKELEALIRQYGGYVLVNIPSDPPHIRGQQQAGLARIKLPIVLSPKKVCFHHFNRIATRVSTSYNFIAVLLQFHH